MSFKTFPVIVVAVLGATLAAPADAASITFPSGAQANTQSKAYVNNNTTLVGAVEEGAGSSAEVTAGANSASASVDMTTGELKAFGNSNAGFQSVATGWEFLVFDGNGTIDFAFALDGTLRNFNSTGMLGVRVSAHLFDVTNWTSYFGSDFDGNTFLQKNASFAESPFGDLVGLSHFADYTDALGVRGLSGNSANCTLNYDTCVVDQVGTILDASLALNSSWTVSSDRVYLLQLQLATDTFNQLLIGSSQTGDFAHTAQFSFINLNGLTVTSASGEFLSQVDAAAVPEPMSLVLLGSGVVGGVLTRRRRHAGSGDE